MGHCAAAAWEFCSCQRKLRVTRVVKGRRETCHRRDYIFIYKLPNLKKIGTGNFITELVCPGSVPGVAVACFFQLLLLQLPVPCQHVSLSSWLCREAGGRLCSRINTEQEFAALSLSYTCRKSCVSSVLKGVWLLWLYFPFSVISLCNSACLFWGKRKD